MLFSVESNMYTSDEQIKFVVINKIIDQLKIYDPTNAIMNILECDNIFLSSIKTIFADNLNRIMLNEKLKL